MYTLTWRRTLSVLLIRENVGSFNHLVATIFCMILETLTRILEWKNVCQISSSKALIFQFDFTFFFLSIAMQFKLIFTACSLDFIHLLWLERIECKLLPSHSSLLWYKSCEPKHWLVSFNYCSLCCFGYFCLLITQDGYCSLKCHCLLSWIHYIYNKHLFWCL